MPYDIIRIALLTVLVCCSRMQDQPVQTEILWDTFAVPHIFGKDLPEMYYAHGWAQMRNHTDLLIKLYVQARGQAAAFLGEDFLPSDKRILLFNLPDQAQKFYQNQDPEYQSYLDAFTAGVNDYASAHAGEIDAHLKGVLPITSHDVIAHVLRVSILEFPGGEDILIAGELSQTGSNAYALSPSKTASGHAMLLMNPHLPWNDLFIWFESQLTAPGFNAYGISLVGMPFLSMAFNDDLGWTHTVNPIDVSDRYVLTLQDDGYLLDGKVEPFDNKSITIRIRQNDGSFREQETTFRYSKHGPIVGMNDRRAYAVRLSGFQNYRIFEQYHKMAMSANFNEFESALKMLQNPMFNVIYADKAGHIFYLFNGNIPVRMKGDFAFWKGTIDGTESALIWDRMHPYQDLPKVLNPPSGFIQNCNDPPWYCSDPPLLNPQSFPAYFSSRATFLRPQRAVNMIRDNPSVSFEQMIQYKHDTKMEAAERFLDDLLAAIEKHPDPAALEAAAILGSWDKNTEADSRGAVLFARWWVKMDYTMFARPWDPEAPFCTPDGIREEKMAVDLLIQATNELLDKYGRADIAWGEIHRLRLDGLDYPANGGPGEYGIFRTVYFSEDTDHKQKAVAGETFTAVVEFGKEVRAQAILPYGNATQAPYRHAGNQLKMMSEKKLRPVWLDKSIILQNMTEKVVLSMKNPI